MSGVRSFAIGLVTGVLVLAPSLPVRAGHLETGCERLVKSSSEIARENGTTAEEGSRAKIQTIFPTGGPVNYSDAAILKAAFIFKSVDNYAEVGWWWKHGTHSSPKRFIARQDGLSYYTQDRGDLGGAEGDWHTFTLESDSANRWKFWSDGDVLFTYTFDNFMQGDPMVFTEVDNTCDSGYGNFKDQADKEGHSDAGWGPWVGNEVLNPSWAVDNPCYYTDILSETRTEMPHRAPGCSG